MCVCVCVCVCCVYVCVCVVCVCLFVCLLYVSFSSLTIAVLPFNEPTTERLYTKIKAAEYTIPDWVSHPAAGRMSTTMTPEL